MGETFIAREKDRKLSLSNEEICTGVDGKTLCVKIDEIVPYGHMVVSGLYTKDNKGNLVPENKEFDTELFDFLIRELRIESRIRRVGKLFFDTTNPMTFRLLKRVGFSTTPASKKNNRCYIDILENEKVCDVGSIRLVKKV